MSGRRSFWGNESGATAPLFALALVALVASGGVAWDISRGYAPWAAPADPPAPEGVFAQMGAALQSPWPALRYWGVNRMRFAVHPDGQPQQVTVLTFQRTALFQWKLVHIRLPEPADT